MGIITAVILFELAARIGYLFTKDRAFGEADTYVAAALGACFGFTGLWSVLFIYVNFFNAFYGTCIFV